MSICKCTWDTMVQSRREREGETGKEREVSSHIYYGLGLTCLALGVPWPCLLA